MTARNRANSSSSQGVAASTRYAALTRVSPDGRASFSASPGQTLAAALDGVIDAGDLLSVSRTSDGGAICLYVKNGVEIFKAYAATQEELDSALQILADAS